MYKLLTVVPFVGADPVGVDVTSVITELMTSGAGEIVKMGKAVFPFVITFTLLGVGFAAVRKLLNKGGNSVTK